MSNFQLHARHRQTRDWVSVEALDDYFGRHQYGYRVGTKVLTERQFNDLFETTNHSLK